MPKVRVEAENVGYPIASILRVQNCWEVGNSQNLTREMKLLILVNRGVGGDFSPSLLVT